VSGVFFSVTWPRAKSRSLTRSVRASRWKTPQTKFDLALEIVIQAAEEGIRFKWVSADGAYGENAFLLPLDDAGCGSWWMCIAITWSGSSRRRSKGAGGGV